MAWGRRVPGKGPGRSGCLGRRRSLLGGARAATAARWGGAGRGEGGGQGGRGAGGGGGCGGGERRAAVERDGEGAGELLGGGELSLADEGDRAQGGVASDDDGRGGGIDVEVAEDEVFA